MIHFLQKAVLVSLGGAIQGLGMGLFLFPQSIPSGGAGGLAILLNYFFNIAMGPSLWIVNFSLLLIGVKYLGKRFALWTIVGISMTSISINFFETHFQIPNRSLFLDLLIGSLFLGTGIGILMRQGVSNGGIGVIAYMLAFKRNILPGRPLFIINCWIFIITAAIVSWKIIFLAFISQWISTKVVDYIYQIKLLHVYTLDWHRKY